MDDREGEEGLAFLALPAFLALRAGVMAVQGIEDGARCCRL